MQLAESVSIPVELERARVADELVVFAGAGVSMGPPANQPSFKGLAKEIGEAAQPLTSADEQALDRYLGRLERSGVLVQERARAKLLERSGGHNPLHEHLLGIFSETTRVRLITTNFDTHFSASAKAVFGSARLPHYVGPALPPGSQFQGIAQLHGSLDQPQDRLVLTDRDFALAYMAEGWAARFLVGVFAKRTILFVGYSLTDPLMRYLVRALPASMRSYALCHQDECSHWADLDVTPVPFATRGDGDKYGDLGDALKRWHWFARASVTDHDRELRKLIAAGPPSSPREADYMRARLESEAGRRTFLENATDTRWFTWVSDEGFLDPLLDETDVESDIFLWAQWCLAHFCSGENPPLLQFARQRGPYLNREFALQLAIHLVRQVPAARPVLRQLIALLVNQRPRKDSGVRHYTWLLQPLVDKRCGEEALALLRWMTSLRLEPLEHLYTSLENAHGVEELRSLTNRVEMTAPASDIHRFLKDHGSGLAALVADELVALGVQRLVEAYQLLALARGADQGPFDWLSLGRTSIAPSNQDSFAHIEDVLVLMVRGGLDHWRTHEPSELSEFGGRYSRDVRYLLRRLAVYALSECSSLSPDDLLERAANEGWAADFQIRPEFFRLLKTRFGDSSETAKANFIAVLRSDTSWGELDEHQAHARFSISQLLVGLDPTSAATKAFAEAERSAHPTWGEGDRDGFLSRVESGFRGEEPSPISPEQMLTWNPAEALERILTELKAVSELDLRHSVLGAVQQAVKAAPTWGVELLALTSRLQEFPSGLADAVIWALRDAPLLLDDRLAFLTLVSGWDWPDDVTRPLASLFDGWSRNIEVGGNHPLLSALDEAADLVYERAETMESGMSNEASWTEGAINHPAGHAASVWWMVANARNKVDGQFVLAIDDAELTRWERVLRDKTPAGGYARVILGMASDRLSTGDNPWAQRVLFPAFDPGNGADRAAQLWDGRLAQHRFSWTTIANLTPYLGAFFSRSATLVPGQSHQLGDFVGLLVTHPAESGVSLLALQQFVSGAAPEARRAFADSLPRHLSELEPEGRRQVWHDTLAPYWRDRRTNVPTALEPEEVGAMIEWVTELPEVAEEAVVELLQTPGQNLPNADRVLWQWREDAAWVRAHPDEASDIIRWLAERSSIDSWTAGDAATQLGIALQAGASRAKVLAAAEAVGALPCRAAIDLADRLRADKG